MLRYFEIITSHTKLLIPYLGVEENNMKLKLVIDGEYSRLEPITDNMNITTFLTVQIVQLCWSHQRICKADL